MALFNPIQSSSKGILNAFQQNVSRTQTLKSLEIKYKTGKG